MNRGLAEGHIHPRDAEIRLSGPLNNPFRVEGNMPATSPRAVLTLALGYGEQSLWASTRGRRTAPQSLAACNRDAHTRNAGGVLITGR